MSFEYSTNNNRVRAVSEKDINKYLSEIVGEKFFKYRQKWDEVHHHRMVSDFPLYLLLEQQYKCNLKCPMCIIAYPERYDFNTNESFMKDELFYKILSEAENNYCPSISMNNTEEPLLNKKCIERIDAAKEHGFIDIMMNTNATLLNDEWSEKLIDSGLTRLLIGFDGNSKETYEQIRVGKLGNYEKVKNNIETFLNIKKKKKAILPVVRLSFVITDINKHEINDYYNYWMNKVDYIAFQEYVPPPVENPNEKLKKQITKHKKNKVYDCDQPYSRLSIRADGEVNPCCTFWGYYLEVGNVNESSIRAIWKSKNMEKIRKSFENNTDISEVCKSCLS